MKLFRRIKSESMGLMENYLFRLEVDGVVFYWFYCSHLHPVKDRTGCIGTIFF